MIDLGASGQAFEPIVACGKNAAAPHYSASYQKIKSGEMVLIDMGARYHNYNADLTRTVFVGKASVKFKEIYHLVLKTQEKAIKDCAPQIPVKEIYNNCIQNFAQSHQENYFTHGLGHGVGIEIHEEPSLTPCGVGNLENNMVFTIEPGLYYLGWGGIRIEDLITLKNNKNILLSKAPKNLIEIAI